MKSESRDSKGTKREPAYRKRISQRMVEQLYDGIAKILIVDKRYRDKNYSAAQLAQDLNTNTRYVSVVLGVRYHLNYTSLVNKLRVDEAMSILADGRHDNLNMQDVADMVGFTSRQSFYSAFTKYAGVTPRAYKLSHASE